MQEKVKMIDGFSRINLCKQFIHRVIYSLVELVLIDNDPCI